MAMTPSIILDGLAFPECPRWRDGALYFSDMHDGVVWRMTPDGQRRKVLEMSTHPGGLGWLPDGTLQLTSMLDRRLLRLTPTGLATVADLSVLSPHPINDMIMDLEGRAYIGNFGFDLNGGEKPRSTALFCVGAGGEIETAARDLMFPNGMVITPDGKTLIVAESFGSRLTAFDKRRQGKLANRRIFADLAGLIPDGICLDEEGGIWVACPEGHKIIRVAAGGAITHDIPLPGRDSYACMLGGTGRRDLYICTARGSRPEKTTRDRAGRIEMLRVDIPGTGLP